jgi:hypothetical protein
MPWVDAPANEFSDLDRTVLSPDGATYEFVAHVGHVVGGWANFWGQGKLTHDPTSAHAPAPGSELQR